MLHYRISEIVKYNKVVDPNEIKDTAKRQKRLGLLQTCTYSSTLNKGDNIIEMQEHANLCWLMTELK